MATNTDGREEIKPVAPTEQTKWRDPSLVGKYMVDPKTGLAGLFRSPDNGETWVLTDTVYGHVYNQDEVDNIWDNGAGHKVADEIKSATADLPNVRKQADSAVKFAESAIAASKVNSDAIVAQSSAVVEAKSAMDSATAEIQQLKANAASDVAQIRADVAQVQNEVDTAKAANSASVDKLKSDIGLAQKDLDNVHDSLTKAQSAVEQNQKLINDSVAKITSDVSATKQDLATVHDSLTKAQAAAEQNQKAINDSIAEINANVDATNQDLAGVRKDLTKAQSDITANQKAIDDNVAQISDDITQDRKDIASAQQANADTAKQLDTYSKQAAEQGKTIKSIQDKQDSFTATLADVQGNVSQVSDKVDGLSASLKDTQGNVATVKAQADQLNATLTDHAKSIATLTASAKELSSTLEDADGRLSKVEQTAQDNSSTLADVQGDLSKVTQTATGLVSTLKDAQGNISTLQQKTDSVSAQLATAQGDIATLQTGVDSVKATLTSHDKSIHTLQADSKSLKDSMADAQGDISALSKTATDVTSELEDHTGRLSKVEQTASKQATTLSDLQGNLSQVKQQADGLVTTLKDARGDITQIQQKADGTLAQLKSAQGDIASLQTNITGIKATLVSHEGDIHTLQADSKTLRDDMADAQGNISSLKKSAADLTSEMSSQDGRLSKVEQTATEHTSTISSLGDKLNNMQIGGRNYLRDSDKSISGWAQDLGTMPNEVLNYLAGETITVSVDTEWSNFQHSDSQQNRLGFELSVTGSDGKSYWFNAWKWPSTPSGKERVYSTFTLPANVAFTVTNNGQNGYVSINGTGRVSHAQVEIGNVSKDWQPAPEDLATVTQVKQTSDSITTTLKNMQGDVDQVTQKANGTSEQLADVKGDVTNVQKDVSGLKQTTADNAGNINTLQSDSKSLHDSMQDIQGNISTLQKTATDVTSELQDHAGRISKVEQTASTLTNEFSDQQGHLNQVEQTATGTKQTVANQQGQISSIQTDVSGIHETITGQGNQIASLNVTLNGLNTKYDGVSGDLSKLSDKVTTNSAQIDQNKQAIALKADQSTVDNLTGEVSQNKAQLKVQAGQISSKVSSTDFKTLDDKVNGMKIGGRNLVAGTGQDTVIDDTANTGTQGWCFWVFNLTQQPKVGDQLTVSAEGTLTGKGNLSAYEAALYDMSMTTPRSNVVDLVPGKRSSEILTVSNINGKGDTVLLIYSGKITDTEGKKLVLHHLKLEFGNVATDWTPAPEDLTTAIQKNSTAIDQTNQKISLKADQTEVDKVKGTASQNSSRIDTMANEISSKVTSTDVNNIVDGKGYATTSTVQSLITQKASTISESITNLTNEVNTRNGVNLLKGTKDFSGSWHNYGSTNYWHTENRIDPNGNHSVKSDSLSWYGYYQPIYLDTGDYTFSGYYYSEGGKPVYFYVKPNSGDNLVEASYTSNLDSTPNGWRWFVVHFKVTKAGNAAVRLESGQNQVLHIASYKLERGTVTKPVWTPAPSDNATVTQVQQITASIDGLQSRVTNYQNDTSSKYTQLSDLMQSKVNQGDLNSVRTQLAGAINERVQKGELLSQINLTAGNTLIQSNKLYLDADSVVFSGKAFIPDAAITNISADKINAGWLNTNNVSLGDGRTRIRADHDYLYIQPTGSASSNTGIRMSYTGLDFLTNVIPNGYNSPVPYYSIGYDGASNGYLRISAFDHLNSGGATATQNWFAMTDAISLNNQEINFASKGNMRMQVNGGGVNIKPTLFFQNNTNNGTWAGFTRGDNSDVVEFSTGDNNGENFRIDCGARFMQYVYINGNARAQQWLTNSTLSKKTNIRKLDQQIALDKIRQDDQYLYEYKRNIEQGIYDPQASFIIDDVNDVSHYSVPREFIDQSGNYREPNVELAYLIAAFQAIDKQVQTQKEEIKELKEKLQHE